MISKVRLASDIVAGIALALWVGGMVFFAAAVAPAAFGVVQDRVLAGSVVSHAMRTLHYLSYGCAVVLITCYTFERARLKAGLVVLMFGIALYSGMAVSPELADIRATAGAINELPDGNPVRQRFDFLHHLSVRLMGFNILAGLMLLGLQALKRPTQ